MAAKTITVLNPTARPGVQEAPIAPRARELNDKVLGFLWNSKPNGDILLRSIRDRLTEKFQVAGTTWQQKHSVATPADLKIIEELARKADAIVNAIGD